MRYLMALFILTHLANPVAKAGAPYSGKPRAEKGTQKSGGFNQFHEFKQALLEQIPAPRAAKKFLEGSPKTDATAPRPKVIRAQNTEDAADISEFLQDELGLFYETADSLAERIVKGGAHEGRALVEALKFYQANNPVSEGGVSPLSQLQGASKNSPLLNQVTKERFQWAVDRLSRLKGMNPEQKKGQYPSLAMPPNLERKQASQPNGFRGYDHGKKYKGTYKGGYRLDEELRKGATKLEAAKKAVLGPARTEQELFAQTFLAELEVGKPHSYRAPNYRQDRKLTDEEMEELLKRANELLRDDDLNEILQAPKMSSKLLMLEEREYPYQKVKNLKGIHGYLEVLRSKRRAMESFEKGFDSDEIEEILKRITEESAELQVAPAYDK